MGTPQAYTAMLDICRELGSALVAFSGGVDSTLVLRATWEALGERAVGVTALSPTYPAEELEEARVTARGIGVRHLVIGAAVMDNPAFTRNDEQRCYHCRQDLYGKLRIQADRLGLAWIVDGTTTDDLADYRPGLQAAHECGVRSPLVEAGFTKALVREVSRTLGLATWDKPAAPCLSSRIPYGTEITMERLEVIEQAEAILRQEGLREVRVRYHGEIARIEVAPDDIPRLVAVRERVVEQVRALGFTYVALDLQGYRQGSLNAGIAPPPA